MYDLYEREYGIGQQGGLNPLSSVSFQNCEDFNSSSLLSDIAREYVLKGIKDTYNISLLEFMELPRDVIEILFSVAEEESVKKQKMMSDIEAEITKK